MSYFVKRTEPNLWTVGHEDASGQWHPASDHGSHEEAQLEAKSLNGSGWFPGPGHELAAKEPRYVSNQDLRDMISDRDTLSIAEACAGNMWMTIRFARLLPDYLPAYEIDEFLEGVMRAAFALTK